MTPRDIFDFFNNQTVGAFLGAFPAFSLVVFNDWRRETKKVPRLASEIKLQRANAKAKLETARNSRDLLRNEDRANGAPVLKFSTALMRSLSTDIADHVSLNQRIAVDALCYTMESIDDLFAEAAANAKAIPRLESHDHRVRQAEELLILWQNISNLKRLDFMCELYSTQKYDELVGRQYLPSEFADSRTD